ncbi:MAG: restriction endonuclease [Bacteroidetes bacterium]|nr:restriction endonuclease [Bacteroidota bacterium]
MTPLTLDLIGEELLEIFESFPVDRTPNESYTEQDLVWPVLQKLGWKASLPQQNLSLQGREDVPDGLLFIDESAKQTASLQEQEFRRYEHGAAILEVKRWRRPLARATRETGETTSPASKMLRYMRRIDDVTEGNLRWGILSNGRNWRLYYSGAKSPGEDYIDLDLLTILRGETGDGGARELFESERRLHWLKVFVILFGCDQFRPDSHERQTFHQQAILDARFYQEQVTVKLSNIVFNRVFPELVRAIAKEAPTAEPSEIRQSALIFLYRLLFMLYAEDRGLLPVYDSRYDDYSFRNKIRNDIGRRKDKNDVFSSSWGLYWPSFEVICNIISEGDASIGLPPYNGGLFDQSQTPLLCQIVLNDEIFANVVDALSFEQTSSGRRYINYRNLGVQQLGSIYEQLLEQDVVRNGDCVDIKLNPSARKNQGSYYTPDELVSLIVSETITPLVNSAMDTFTSKVSQLDLNQQEISQEQLNELHAIDPARALLDLKICDPAMGSGHFLVNLVDQLAEQVLIAIEQSASMVDGYTSPVVFRVNEMQKKIHSNAEEYGCVLEDAQLDEQRLVRRIVSKRCIYGVDKNPMAVELAKVSLWLHTLTTGTPLSFLDHHLVCGDSLFGTGVREALAYVERHGYFMREPVLNAVSTMDQMEALNNVRDIDVADISQSGNIFSRIAKARKPLNAFVALYHAFEWLNLKNQKVRQVFSSWLDGEYGDPVQVALGSDLPPSSDTLSQEAIQVMSEARDLVKRENFLIWEITYPDVWASWSKNGEKCGFDAIVGNPPWERMELKLIEWFAARRPEIAYALTAADRSKMIAELKESEDPLAEEFERAKGRFAMVNAVVQRLSVYEEIGAGKNLYALFLVRSLMLTKPSGVVGLLIPSGIASDKQFAALFRGIAHQGKLRALYDFQNRSSTRFNRQKSEKSPFFFPDVDGRFKFCVFVASPTDTGQNARCAFFLDDPSQTEDLERCFEITPEDFRRVNPNTGTAPIFRTRRDAKLTMSIYERMPVLVKNVEKDRIRAWPVRYYTMYNTGSDSNLFRTRDQLLGEEKAYPIENNRFRNREGEWVPLYEGKMVQAFDHRASDVIINPENLFRPGQKRVLMAEEKKDPTRLPEPRFWVLNCDGAWPEKEPYMIGFKDVTSVTNMRTMIAALIPKSGVGHTLPLLQTTEKEAISTSQLLCMLANLNSIVFDYVARQKVQTTHFSWFVLKQMPVVPLDDFDRTRFGAVTAHNLVWEAVLELTYTSDDMSSLPQNLDRVGDTSKMLSPFLWDEERRLSLRAKLDAIFFHLYGITSAEDIRYIYETFPIIRKKEEGQWGQYQSLQLCLSWFNALEAGDPYAGITV